MHIAQNVHGFKNGGQIQEIVMAAAFLSLDEKIVI